jgi:RecB family exonuclease
MLTLAGFICDVLAYAAAPAPHHAERARRSPHSGVARDEAALPPAFVAALDEIAVTLRAQGIGAREVVVTVVARFPLDAAAGDAARATLDSVLACAAAFDAARAPGEWDPAALVAAIGDALERPVATAEPRRAPVALGPHAREEGAPVERRTAHFSASSLGAYAECERRWFYRYVCAAVEDRGSSASFYGSAFHWALEQFHGEYPRGDAAPAEVLERKLGAWIGESFDRYRRQFATNVEFELQKRRALRTGRRYLAWFLDRSRAHPFTVVGREELAEIELGGYPFVGYIDRLDRDDASGNVTVVDYKTGTIAESAAEYRKRIAEFVDFQLPFYYWARTAAGDHVVRLALVPLKDALLDVRPIELEVVPVPSPVTRGGEPTGLIGIDELERARARMIELARHLRDEPIEHFAVTTDPEACTFCAYRDACRDRPRRSEDRFGR